VVPENIHTHPKEGYWKFKVGGGSQKPNFLRKVRTKYKLSTGIGGKVGGRDSKQKAIHGRDMDISWNRARN